MIVVVAPEPQPPLVKEALTESLSIGMPLSTKDAVRSAAAAAGLSMSAWGLEAVKRKLEGTP